MKNKLEYRYEWNGLGVWFIPQERTISLYCDKKSWIIKYIPRFVWKQWNNADVAQRSIFY